MAKIKTSDEALDYYDQLDDLADSQIMNNFRGSRSEEEDLSDLFDDPGFGGDAEDEEDED